MGPNNRKFGVEKSDFLQNLPVTVAFGQKRYNASLSAPFPEEIGGAAREDSAAAHQSG